MCSIGVEAYTISRADESVLCQSQFEDIPVNSSERFGSEYDDETNKEVLNLKQENLELNDKLSTVTRPATWLSILVMIKPVFTQDSPHILAGFLSLLRFFSRLVPNKPVGFGLKASEQLLLVLVKLKQAVQNQDFADRFCIHIT